MIRQTPLEKRYDKLGPHIVTALKNVILMLITVKLEMKLYNKF